MRSKTTGGLIRVLLLSCGLTSAQEFRALITGTVLDPSGSAIAGASVSIRNIGTNLAANVETAVDGTYFIPQLPTGTYELTIEAKGFKKYVRQQITLDVAAKARVDARMELGAATESVTVTAELTGIEGDLAITGQLLDNRQVTDIPAPGRNYLNLLQLTAGVLCWEGIYGGILPTDGTAWEN